METKATLKVAITRVKYVHIYSKTENAILCSLPFDTIDTTDHNILITRLRSTFICSGTVLEWFISYLNCRTQSVCESCAICSEMWSAAGFCSGTSSIYSVNTHFKYRYLSI